jgi:hypothetical protein
MSRDLAAISRDFWRGVNSGEVRLTSAEDALLASLRAAPKLGTRRAAP